VHQQPGENGDIGPGPQRQVQIGDFAGCRAPRIDDDDPGAVRVPGGDQPLVQHRMTPGRITADQNDKIGRLDVVVAAGNDILAEGADVAGDARRHAQPRVGVDIGAADEALHQLVGDVIVLGQQLARDVERDRIGAGRGDRLTKGLGDEIERLIPAGGSATDLGM